MATLMSVATGNFTASSTWAVCDATSELDSEVGTVVISTTNIDSAAFTPGAITTDGIAVKVSARAASPTGTITITLRNSTAGADVTSTTINVSDINVNGNGWYFFKFSAPQLLIVATNYLVRAVCSNTGSQVTLYRNATSNNLSRQLRTTTTAAPASADKLFVCGEFTGAGTGNDITVTMDETATTSYGPTVSGGPPQGMTINSRGTMTFGVASSTAYYLKLKGILGVYSNGTLNMGTSGTPLPATSTSVLEFDSAANVDSGLRVENGGIFNAYGATKTTLQTLLNTDEAAAQTLIGVVATTDWAVSDELAFASTTRTASECEKKTILTVDSGVQVTLTAGLTNAHSGTSPTQAEVANLTRNVKIRGVSTSLQGFVVFDDVSTVACRYVEFYNLGSNTSNKRGIDCQTTTGSCDVQFCSLHDFIVAGSVGFNVSGSTASNITFSSNVGYSVEQIFFTVAATTGTWTCSGNLCIRCPNAGGGAICFALADVGGTFTNNVAVGSGTTGISLTEAGAIGTFSGNSAHANGGSNMLVSATLMPGATISSLTLWRSSGASNYGLRFTADQFALTIDGLTMFGNNGANLNLAANMINCAFRNLVLSGDTTFSTAHGLFLNVAAGVFVLEFDSSTFGVVTGIKTAHTNDWRIENACYLQAVTRNCSLASGTQFSQFSTLCYLRSSIRNEKWGQVAATHKSYVIYSTAIQGTVEYDASVFNTAAPSQKITPGHASAKLESGPLRAKVDSSGTATFTVSVRKSAAYNGNQPRLVLRKNHALGITSDAVLDTMTVGTETWEQLTGTSGTANDDGILEAFVDCDGTAGYVNVDDWV